MDELDIEISFTTDRMLIISEKRKEMALQLKNLYPAKMPECLQEAYNKLNKAFIEAIQEEAKYLSSLK